MFLQIVHTLLKYYRTAKQQQIRIWKGYKPATIATLPQGSLVFSGKVIEVVNGDSLLIKRGEQQLQKIWFSSLRPPRSVMTNHSYFSR